jgi:hypothetical protein
MKKIVAFQEKTGLSTNSSNMGPIMSAVRQAFYDYSRYVPKENKNIFFVDENAFFIDAIITNEQSKKIREQLMTKGILTEDFIINLKTDLYDENIDLGLSEEFSIFKANIKKVLLLIFDRKDLIDFFSNLERIDSPLTTYADLQGIWQAQGSQKEISPIILQPARTRNFLRNKIMQRFPNLDHSAIDKILVALTRNYYFDSNKDSSEVLVLSSFSDNELDGKEIGDVSLSEVYLFLQSLLGETEVYIYDDKDSPVNISTRHLNIMYTYAKHQLQSANSDESNLFYYPWIHTHISLENAKPHIEYNSLLELERNVHLFSEDDNRIIMDNTKHPLIDAYVVSERGVTISIPSIHYRDSVSNKFSTLKPDEKYTKYMRFRIRYEDVISFLTEQHKRHNLFDVDNVEEKIIQKLSAQIAHWNLDNIYTKDLVLFMKENNVKQQWINKVINREVDSQENSLNIFGMQMNDKYREEKALEAGYYPIFVSHQKMNEFIEKHGLESASIEDVFEFYVAKHSQMFPELVRQQYHLDSLFNDYNEHLHVQRSAIQEKIDVSNIANLLIELILQYFQGSIFYRPLNPEKKEEALQLFQRLWSAGGPLEAKQIKDQILGFFSSSHQNNTLYQDNN